ncbi:hypothetical protein N7539_000429 [Penicillium diatomitis]|uniref:Lytic polysaccharide monooxygenase n=1 Tax=Penicillium diatomitis TaxID=2819901 RepID=A0A9W9XLX5_9EURO|nr:uncharacterized protein N7539_000429 [Penicillium diatomitis]KAJ5495313.1 hypothetical protein N7539_000429 [Penicillium diatomitis]
MFVKSFLIAALGVAGVNAHMKMAFPVPYGKDTLDNSPLKSQGEDFPCKLRGNTYTVSTENMMEIGVNQTLQLLGQATHGGGSCQISLTEDRAPTKDTVWKVIKSFHGGCPTKQSGNLGGDANAMDPDTWKFAIPEDIAPGKYTLAWTWFNRIGNREMYMNCAPVTVTGGSSKRDVAPVQKRTANYPPMFVANVNGCTTQEGVDIRFPQPGPNVETWKEDPKLAPEGVPACSGVPKFGGAGDTTASGSSAGSGSGSSGSGAGTGSSSGSGSGSGAQPVSSTIGGGAPTGSPSQTGAPVPVSTAAPNQTTVLSVPQPGLPSTSSVAPLPSSTSEPNSQAALSGPCNNEGSWNCIAGTAFQRCASGQWTPRSRWRQVLGVPPVRART